MVTQLLSAFILGVIIGGYLIWRFADFLDNGN